jgi:predicted dehydrogenase
MSRPGVPRVGLIGISGYGRVYLRCVEAALARGELEFAAATVINSADERETCARLAGRGVQLYDSWQAMLEGQRGKLDLCLLPVPIHLHAPIAVAALEAGANVLVEKPLAGSVAQARLIQEAEQRTGRWVAVGFQDYYAPSTRAIAEGLAAGRIGRVEKIQWLGVWPRAEAYYKRNAWAGKLQAGGLPVRDSPLNNAMAHFLNLSLLWAGGAPGRCAWPEAVRGELFRTFPIESFDTAVVQIETDSGIGIQACATHCCRQECPVRIRVKGSGGELDWIARQEWSWTRKGRTEKHPLESFDASVDRMFGAVLRRWRDSGVPVCTTEHALSQVACIESLHASSPIRDAAEAFNGRTGLDFFERLLKKCLRQECFPSQLGSPEASGLPEAVADPVQG